MKVKAIALAAIVSPMIGFSQNFNSSIRCEQVFSDPDQVLDQLGKYESEWKVKRLNELPYSDILFKEEVNYAFKNKEHFLLEVKEFLFQDYKELMSGVDAQECNLEDLESIDERVYFDLRTLIIEGHICRN
jgi:hypothetical protein